VARHTAAAVTGLQAAGVVACTKHFPGHGRTGTDTHEAIATIEGGLDELRRRDLPPFEAAIRAGTIAIMPSHLRVPELTGDLPATVSGAALTGLLRGELGFADVIVSDALEIRATRDAFGIPGAAVLAVAAGTDLLCLGRDSREDDYLAVRTALVGAVRDGTLAGERLEQAAGRVARLRGGLARTWPDRGAAMPEGRTGGSPQGSPDVRTAADAEPPVDHRGRAAGEHRGGPVHLGPEPVGAGRQRTPRPCPGGAGFAAGILEASAGRSLVLVVRDAHRAPATSSMVTELLTARPVLVLVEMGLPLWRPPDGTGHLVTYGASRASAQAAAERLGLL
jgi:beta-N-acetylhexosaminidase